MATQLQGPLSDPCVLYKHFWQELQRPMHKDDLILQACHYQPSDTPLGPSFSPCDYFPSPWKKRTSRSGSLALLFPIGPTNGRESKPLPACQPPTLASHTGAEKGKPTPSQPDSSKCKRIPPSRPCSLSLPSPQTSQDRCCQSVFKL